MNRGAIFGLGPGGAGAGSRSSTGGFAKVESIVKGVQELERMGFDFTTFGTRMIFGPYFMKNDPSGWDTSKLDNPEGANPDRWDPFPLLGYLAAKTEKIGLGTSVLVPSPRHPVVLAKQLIHLDLVSNGRIHFGLGSGPIQEKAGYFEHDWPNRGELLDEYTGAINAIWENELASYHGKHFKFDNVEVFPRPIQKHAPIWFGGRGPALLRRTGKMGRGLLVGRGTVEEFLGWMAYVKKHQEKAGRKHERIEFIYGDRWCIAPTREEAYKLAGLDGDPDRVVMVAYTASEHVVEPALTVAQARKRGFIGTPDEVRERVRYAIDQGVTGFRVGVQGRGEERHKQLKLIMKEVIEKL